MNDIFEYLLYILSLRKLLFIETFFYVLKYLTNF